MGKTTRRQGTMALIILLILAIASASSAFAYPIVISESPINHTQTKQLVYSIPETYYKYIDVVEFVNNSIQNKNMGYSEVKWNSKHYCYYGKITMFYQDKDFYLKYLGYDYNKEILIHEIGHIYDFCINKVNVSTENYANNFKIR